MININKIPLDYEPRKKFFTTPPLIPGEPEMSEFESAFLCGLLEKFRPKKILEVGVAGGATTAIILNCLEKIGQEYEMYSIDILKNVWNNPKKNTGYLAEETRKNLTVGTHKFYIGTVLPFVIDEIGNDINFVILDTAHLLPGEVLDFLVALPYLNENAVICMHDVSLNQRDLNFRDSHATSTLFSAVNAKKFLNFINFIPKGDILNANINSAYPNIAAFQITEDTMKNIENVFLTLILRWRYLPEEKDLAGYSTMLEKLYPQDLYLIFLEAFRMNARNLIAESQLRAAQK